MPLWQGTKQMISTTNASKHCPKNKHHEIKILELQRFEINEQPFYLPKGYYLVSDLKMIANVSSAHVLSEIQGTKVFDLQDDCAVHIEGNEVFKSSPGLGQNS